MSGVLLALLRRERGDETVRRVMELAGEDRTLEEIEDSTQWSSKERTRCLYVAAMQLTDDRSLPRRAGGTVLHEYAGGEVIAIMRSLEGPAAVLELAPVFASKQTTITLGECLESTDGLALIAHRKLPPHKADPIWCEYAIGVYGSIPEIFGLRRADVEEIECAVKGGDRCVFKVTWNPEPEKELATENEYLQRQVTALTERFEALEALATELTSADDIDKLLETITGRAAVAVRAFRYLLAVKLPRDTDRRVHRIGIGDDEVERIADEVLADPPDDRGGSRLIVDIASSTHFFGRLAALQPEGAQFAPEERRLLTAYAAHGAAALVAAAALAETRNQVVTLRTLLDLSADLADVHSIDEAAERLATSLPKVLDCEVATVLVWDTQAQALVRRASSAGFGSWDRPDDHSALSITPDEHKQLLGVNGPVSFGPTVSHPTLQAIGTVAGFPVGLAMPVVARGELHGVIAVGTGRGEPMPLGGSLAGRLPGVAGLAATTFLSAKLLEQIRYQAYHDALTGLPNLRALEALSADDEAEDPAALIFVDLDGFKQVNDRYGHSAGDELLVEVGRRLREAVRSRDVVVRIGGDEFAVLLAAVESTAESEAIARRFLENVRRPVVIGGQEIRVTASIGVAPRALDDESVEAMLSRSDHAMYRAKMSGRATICLAE